MIQQEQEVLFGALLHDIGKLIQRAFGSVSSLNWTAYDMASTLCPTGKFGGYTHQHVLYTSALFDLMQEQACAFPGAVELENVAAIAGFHHTPDNAPAPAIAWICALADRYSAGMDRRSEDDEAPAPRTRAAYRRLPLRCIFDEIFLDPDKGVAGKHCYGLRPLLPESPDCLLPIDWRGESDDLPAQYRELWEAFRTDFLNICGVSWSSTRLFEESLLGLLERYTWAIPSSTIDVPDISLYDHSLTTAAVAVCLYRYHASAGNLDDLRAIKDSAVPKFRFLAGDLSGIQETLFTLEKQGVKGVNKILRARSFVLTAIVEAAVFQILDALDLPKSCVLQEAGGRFLLLVPNTAAVSTQMLSLTRRFDEWLFENYTGSLSLNLALTEPFAGKDLALERFQAVMAGVKTALEDAKHRPLNTCAHGIVPLTYPLEKACSTCGVRPATTIRDSKARCRTCEREMQIGRRLVRSVALAWGRDLDLEAPPETILGLQLYLLDASSDPQGNLPAISVKRFRTDVGGFPWPLRIMANYIPRFPADASLGDDRYSGIVGDDEPVEPEAAKTFAHIGAEARERNENGHWIGKPFLALLKADVDNLGLIFSYGLKSRGDTPNRFSISRLTQLSRMMDMYFSGYLQGVIRRDFPDTYTVFAGGDDLLLIGPWRQMLHLASRVADTFARYVGQNPHISISAGLSLLHPNHPVNRAAKDAEHLLDGAKAAGRNRVSALIPIAIPWVSYGKALADAEWVHSQMNAERFGVGSGFVYHIMLLAREAELTAKGEVRKAGWRARLAYHLARNVKGASEKDKKEKIGEWLRRLGMDDLLRLIETEAHQSLWRLPLSIALYRNRN